MLTDRNILKELLADPAKRRAWVSFQLKLKGESFASIARLAGVTRQAVRLAMYKQYPRMEFLIAAILDMRPADLFPERYDAYGRSIRRPIGRPKKTVVKCSTFPAIRNIKKMERISKVENESSASAEQPHIPSACSFRNISE